MNTRLQFRTTLPLVLLLGFTVPPARAQSIGGMGGVIPFQISADGTVVVGNDASGNAVRWTAAGGKQILKDSSNANGVSMDGSVVVGTTSGAGAEGWQWTEEGGTITLSEPTPDGDYEFSSYSTRGVAKADNGVITIVGSATGGGYKVIRWVNGSPEIVDEGIAHDASQDASVIVGGEFEDGVLKATRWANGSRQVLGDGLAQAVSADGSVAIGITPDHYPVRWGPDGETVLANETGSAKGVSGDGSVVVGLLTAGPSAFIWTKEGGLRVLKEVLEQDYGLSVSEFNLDWAQDISADGNVIVGQDFNDNGGGDGWRVGLGCALVWDNASGGAFGTAENWQNVVDPYVQGADGQCEVYFDTGSASYDVTLDEDFDAALLSVGTDLVTLDLKSKTFHIDPPAPDDLSLAVGTSSGETGSLLLTGGTLTSGDGTVAVGAGGDGTLTISSGAVVKAPKDFGGVTYFHVGQSKDAAGDVLVEAGGTLETFYIATLGEATGSEGTGTVEGDGSSWKARSVFVGNQGTGTLAVRDKGLFETDFFYVGQDADATGSVQVTGSGTRLSFSDTGEFILGVSGTGELTVEGGAEVVQPVGNNTVLGVESGSQGTATVTGSGSKWTSEGLLAVGAKGAGTLKIENGAEAAFETMDVAVQEGGVEADVVRVSNATLKLTLDDGKSSVGRSGEGRIEVLGGAKLEIADHNLFIGGDPADPSQPGEGVLEVIGSEMQMQGGMALGDRSLGTASILAGSTVSAGSIIIGFLDGSSPQTSTLEVTESSVTTTQLIVGGGHGEMTVGQNGTVATDFGIIGEIEGANGTLYVTGSGASLTAAALTVGAAGMGLLDVQGGGSVTTPVLQVGASGTVNGRITVAGVSSGKSTVQAEEGIRAEKLLLAPGAALDTEALVFGPGGEVGGSGVFPIDLSNVGLVSPGDTTGATGTFTAGANYTQAVSGVLAIELGGVAEGEYDVLQVTGDAVLGGTLRLSLLKGYRPEVGHTFEIVTAEAITGAFAQVDEPEGIVAGVTYGETAVTVTLTEVTTTPVEEPAEELPTAYVLEQNYPNPFNPYTTIRYALPEPAEVRLTVFDAYGREVERPVDEVRAAGRHTVVFRGGGLASGVYFYRLRAGTFEEVRKMLLVK